MIDKIQFKQHPKLKQLNQTFDLKRINILIGKNGSGKSTFINNLLNQNISGLNKTNNDEIEFLYKDFCEDMKSSEFKYGNDQSKYLNCLVSHFESRGEFAYATYIEGLDTIKNKLILMDEPERGLDIDNFKLLIEKIKNNTSCQFIIATHNLYLMVEFKDSIIELSDGYFNKIKKWSYNKLKGIYDDKN